MSAAVTLDEPGIAAMARARENIPRWYRTAHQCIALLRKYRAEGDGRYAGRFCDALSTIRFARNRIAVIRTLTPDTICTECAVAARVYTRLYPSLTVCSSCMHAMSNTVGT